MELPKSIDLNPPKPSYDIYILYACNEWKEYSSMKLVAATTDRDTLYSIMADEISKGHMGYMGETGKSGIVMLRKDYKGGNADPGKLEFGFVQETKNECYISPDSSMRYYQFYELLNMDDEEFVRHFPVASDDEADMEYSEEEQTDEGLEL